MIKQMHVLRVDKQYVDDYENECIHSLSETVKPDMTFSSVVNDSSTPGAL